MRLHILVLSLLPLYCNAQQGPFELIIMRIDNTNTLSLSCRDSSTAIDIQNPSFWINTTMRELRDRLDRRDEIYLVTAQSIMFVINRDLEGLYFCGSDVNTISEMIGIIGE